MALFSLKTLVSSCLIITALTIWPSLGNAHSGGLNKFGCHGGSQPYHCHGGGQSSSGTTLDFVVPETKGVFDNCSEARRAGYSNIRRGTYGYSSKLDRDGDGIACEKGYTPNSEKPRSYTTPSTTSPSRSNTSNRFFENCTQARSAGYSNIKRGEPGYHSRLDRDGDGIACETTRSYTRPSTTTQGSHTIFNNCSEAEAMGYSNITRGSYGYSSHLDRDGDGIACESNSFSTTNAPNTSPTQNENFYTLTPNSQRQTTPSTTTPKKPRSGPSARTAKAVDQCIRNTTQITLPEGQTKEEYCTCFAKTSKKHGVIKAYNMCR